MTGTGGYPPVWESVQPRFLPAASIDLGMQSVDCEFNLEQAGRPQQHANRPMLARWCLPWNLTKG